MSAAALGPRPVVMKESSHQGEVLSSLRKSLKLTSLLSQLWGSESLVLLGRIRGYPVLPILSIWMCFVALALHPDIRKFTSLPVSDFIATRKINEDSIWAS